MLEFPLIFLGGLLGSAHCVGMCGGIAVAVGGQSPDKARSIARQLAFSAGRIFTYAALGGAVGYAGLRLTSDAPTVVHAQAALALLAGVLLVVLGLVSAGLLRWPKRMTAQASWRPGAPAMPAARAVGPACLATGLVGAFLRAGGPLNAFLAGVFTGFLPCGLVYSFLALACSTASFALGAATMVAFGLGTVPLMVLVGSGASLLPSARRQQLLRVAAWCVVIAGVIALARGAAAWNVTDDGQAPACPICATPS
ncbi:MAG: sulfite exporter TauE/SafE family protein [Pirellulales bacterium]